MDLTDKQLIQKIKNGEIDYFTFIVKKYSVVIRRLVTAKLFDKQDTDDLVQSTFINFYKAINIFSEDKPIKPYLIQIARNELKMYFRSHKVALPLNEQIVAEENEFIFIKDDLTNIFKKLSQNQQKVLKLLSDGYSYKEIAGQLDKPLNTIKTLVRRARLAINQLYEKS